MKTRTPFLSVIMPVYNGEKYLRLAIDSILNQTYSHYEFIIINDGSTDGTHEIINSYNDIRIKYIVKPNTGLIDTLNIGIESSQGEWLARMDADDISYPTRLEEQVKYISNDTAVIGTQAVIINELNERISITKFSLDHGNIYEKLLQRNNSLIHPSVLINKRKLLEVGSYDSKMKVAEDYDLWLRISKVGKLVNINKPLIGLRKHDNNISKKGLKTATINALISLAYHTKYFKQEKISTNLYNDFYIQIDKLSSKYINHLLRFEGKKCLTKKKVGVKPIYIILSNPTILYYYFITVFSKFILQNKIKGLKITQP